MTIDYHLQPTFKHSYVADEKIKDASESSLRYDFFTGDIILKDGDTDISMRWGWIPILDFALALKNITNGIEEGSEQLLDFTESDATIQCIFKGNMITLQPSYTDAVIKINFREFQQNVDVFCDKVVRDLLNQYPDLKFNHAFQSIIKNEKI